MQCVFADVMFRKPNQTHAELMNMYTVPNGTEFAETSHYDALSDNVYNSAIEDAAEYDNPVEDTSGYDTPVENRAGYVNMGESTAGYDNPVEDASGYDNPVENRAGYVNIGEDTAAYVNPVENRAGYVNLSEDTAGYVNPVENRAGYDNPVYDLEGYSLPVDNAENQERPTADSAGYSSNGHAFEGTFEQPATDDEPQSSPVNDEVGTSNVDEPQPSVDDAIGSRNSQLPEAPHMYLELVDEVESPLDDIYLHIG